MKRCQLCGSTKQVKTTEYREIFYQSKYIFSIEHPNYDNICISCHKMIEEFLNNPKSYVLVENLKRFRNRVKRNARKDKP